MQDFQEVQQLIDANRLLLEETRQSIERCESMPKIDSLAAMKYHRPDKRLKTPH